MQNTRDTVGDMCIFDTDFQIQSAMRRHELFLSWAQYEHDLDFAEQEEYDEQHFDLPEQDMLDAFYKLEWFDAFDAIEHARQEAFYGARDLLSDD